jgi:hypothetical protein
MLSVVMLSVVMLSVVMLNAVMLSVVMLNVVILSAVAPITVSHFHASLVFAGKDRSLPLIEKATFSLAKKYLTRVELAGSDEQTSLEQCSLNFDRKKFYSTGPKSKNGNY